MILHELKWRQWLLTVFSLLVLIGLVTFFYGPKAETVQVSADTVEHSSDVFLPVIMYHAISKDPAKIGEYVITPEMFRADMQYLKREGYTTVTVEAILDYVDYGVPLPERPVLVTFDDGQYSIWEYIYPIMEEENLHAVINIEGVFTEAAVLENDPNPDYAYLTWTEISLLQESGLFEIGNHTYDMHHVSGLRSGAKRNPGEGEADYETALRSDVGYLQDLLWAQCGIVPDAFAYPFGFLSEESVPILGDMGFRVLFTCYETHNYLEIAPHSVLLLNRYNRSGNLTTETYMTQLLHR